MVRGFFHESYHCGPRGLEIRVREAQYQGDLSGLVWLLFLIGSWYLLPWCFFFLTLCVISMAGLLLGSKIEQWLGVDSGILRIREGRLELLNLGLPFFLPLSMTKELGSVHRLGRQANFQWGPERGFFWQPQIDLGSVVLMGSGEDVVLAQGSQERLEAALAVIRDPSSGAIDSSESSEVIQVLREIDEEMAAAGLGESTLALLSLLEHNLGLPCLDLPPRTEFFRQLQCHEQR